MGARLFEWRRNGARGAGVVWSVSDESMWAIVGIADRSARLTAAP